MLEKVRLSHCGMNFLEGRFQFGFSALKDNVWTPHDFVIDVEAVGKSRLLLTLGDGNEVFASTEISRKTLSIKTPAIGLALMLQLAAFKVVCPEKWIPIHETDDKQWRLKVVLLTGRVSRIFTVQASKWQRILITEYGLELSDAYLTIWNEGEAVMTHSPQAKAKMLKNKRQA